MLAVAFFAVASLGLAGVLTAQYVLDPNPFDPLGKYPVQQVTSPVVTNGEAITVDATKCSTAPESVTVKGTFYWVSVVPGGYKVFGGGGVGERVPGCTKFHYTNPMPADMVAINEHLFGQGIAQVTWRLVGGDIPIDVDGSEGVPRPYHSTSFTVVPSVVGAQ